MNLKGGNNKMKSGFLTPSLNDALKVYEEEKKKRGQQKILYIPGGKNKLPPQAMIKQSILQPSKKRLSFFKGPRGKQPRFFGPKGIDPLLFTHTLAGFMGIGHGDHGPHDPNIRISNIPFLPHGPALPPEIPQNQNQKDILRNQKNNNKGHNISENENIPHPLCPDCKKLFGITKDNPDKLKPHNPVCKTPLIH